MIEACGACRYFEVYDLDTKKIGKEGECHESPPKAGIFQKRGKWPPVLSTEWCGKFEALTFE